MKKLFLTLFIASATLGLKAQEEPIRYNQNLTFGIHGNRALFIYKTNLNGIYANRFSAGGSYSNETSIRRNYNLATISEDHSINSLFYVGYGVQRAQEIDDKLSIFYGVDFTLYHSKNITNQRITLVDESHFNSFGLIENGDYIQEKIISPNHIGVNATPLLGVNYNLKERIQLGLEYRVQLINYGIILGRGSVEQTYFINDTWTENNRDNSFDSFYYDFNLGLNGSTTITIAYLF